MLRKVRVYQNGANCCEAVVDADSYLLSYGKVICAICEGKTVLDKNYWNISVTTAKHRNAFLRETTKKTEDKLKSGEYILADLN